MTCLAILACAVALAGSACTMKNTEQPNLSGPSELGLSLSLYANPDVLPQDGASQSVIVIQARDGSGQAVKNLPLHFDLTVNNATTSPGKLSTVSANTDSDGRATVTYTAPPGSVGNTDSGAVVSVKVTPTGTNSSNAAARSVDIRLAPSTSGSVGPVASFTYSPITPPPNTNVTFNASASRSDAAIVSYLWDFGDGSKGTGVSPQHVYRVANAYTVTLTVTDANGRTSNPVSDLVQVGDAKESTADFVYSPSAPLPGATIVFDASPSKAGSGRTIVDYAWNFGDGSNQIRGISAVWRYAIAGTYAVTLKITDDLGKTYTATKAVTVTYPNSTPDFTFSPGTPTIGATITFDAGATKPGTGRTITTYVWNFGDGSVLQATTSPIITKAYTDPIPNSYVVTLRIVDDLGATFTVSKTVNVTAPKAP